MSLIFLLAAAAPTDQFVAGPPPATVESLTTPKVDIDCKVIGRDKVVRSLVFHSTGTQGYPTGGTPAVKATEASFEVKKDETGYFAGSDRLFDDASAKTFSGSLFRVLGRFDETGNGFTAVRFFPTQVYSTSIHYPNQSIFFPNQAFSAAVVVERQSPYHSVIPEFAFAGMCQITETQQLPLRAAPLKKDSGQ